MANVLADLCLESEAATALVMRVARGFDESPGDERERLFTRLATPIVKYWVTKRAVVAVAEAPCRSTTAGSDRETRGRRAGV